MRHDKLAAGLAGVAALATLALAETPRMEQEARSNDCPDAVRGVALALGTTDGGVSLRFTTTRTKQLADLRLLLREAATVIEHQSKLAALHPELVERTEDKIVLPAVDIDVTDIATGAQVIVRAENPAELGQVRTHARELEQLWGKSQCVRGKAVASRNARPRR